MAWLSLTLPADAAMCSVVDQQRAVGIVPSFDHADCSRARPHGQRVSDCMGSDLLSFTLMRKCHSWFEKKSASRAEGRGEHRRNLFITVDQRLHARPQLGIGGDIRLRHGHGRSARVLV